MAYKVYNLFSHTSKKYYIGITTNDSLNDEVKFFRKKYCNGNYTKFLWPFEIIKTNSYGIKLIKAFDNEKEAKDFKQRLLNNSNDRCINLCPEFMFNIMCYPN